MARTPQAKRSTQMADTVANTFEWLITAFILAFVFRAFVMEAFRIPTGSMADTLKGAHFRLRCVECGYRYDYGFVQRDYGFSEEFIPKNEQEFRPEPPRCPSCGYMLSSTTKSSVASGDRILVLKTLYQFREPDRWDVVVFKNPEMPRINFIKRLVGKPGEKIQIIDGDIYINDKLVRKPPHVQDELWMPVYNNDYRPVNPEQPYFNRHTWRQPFENVGPSTWNFTSLTDPSAFTLDSPGKVSTAVYNSAVGNEIKAIYAYNANFMNDIMPVVTDVKLTFSADTTASPGLIGIAISKYETLYKATVDANGLMSITASTADSQPVTLASTTLKSIPKGKFVPVSFSSVDHMLTFNFGDSSISKDLGTDPNSAGKRVYGTAPYVGILGSGKLTLSHIALYRDTAYLDVSAYGRMRSRASEKEAFMLGEDEFFVCGDNSPNSHDSRWWDNYGIGNNKQHYPKGIVPRDYLVGKAMFVYWPSGFSPFNNPRLPALIPNFGALRFIYGGVPGYN